MLFINESYNNNSIGNRLEMGNRNLEDLSDLFGVLLPRLRNSCILNIQVSSLDYS